MFFTFFLLVKIHLIELLHQDPSILLWMVIAVLLLTRIMMTQMHLEDQVVIAFSKLFYLVYLNLENVIGMTLLLIMNSRKIVHALVLLFKLLVIVLLLRQELLTLVVLVLQSPNANFAFVLTLYFYLLLLGIII